jgi:hypothetical protein
MIIFLDFLKSHDEASSLPDLSSFVKVHIPISVWGEKVRGEVND